LQELFDTMSAWEFGLHYEEFLHSPWQQLQPIKTPEQKQQSTKQWLAQIKS